MDVQISSIDEVLVTQGVSPIFMDSNSTEGLLPVIEEATSLSYSTNSNDRRLKVISSGIPDYLDLAVHVDAPEGTERASQWLTLRNRPQVLLTGIAAGAAYKRRIKYRLKSTNQEGAVLSAPILVTYSLVN